ncbi:DUF3179 domain-containing (seleno)protein [Paenisporosarcina sp. TG20]|uniref:DUF3179 domain-containing (seleno)protein n=1 Tax=Paenisporosarcina sp. TG20 TaxID=1211706 RepID=UPI00030387C7|nr:DUF3179 domain-containing (seleno)protein [Paenisporosarcina sp. TG20]
MTYWNTKLDMQKLHQTWKKTNFTKHVDDLWGSLQVPGVERDEIPPLDNPHFQSVSKALESLPPRSAMIVVPTKNEVKAYRVDDVMLHEIVNDKVDGEPIAVTFCPLCNSAIVFKRVINGQNIRLGVSGMLRNFDLVMWDDVTESWWQQFTGQAILGEWTGKQLEALPSQILSIEQVSEQYPSSQVLLKTENDPHPPAHQTGDFKERGASMVDTSKIFATTIKNQPVAISYERLRKEKVINYKVNGFQIVVLFNEEISDMGIESGENKGQALMYSSRNRERDLHFEKATQETYTDQETNSTWNLFGEAISGPLKGENLVKLISYPHFKKPWFEFYPNTLFLS